MAKSIIHGPLLLTSDFKMYIFVVYIYWQPCLYADF